ncbi:MAG: Cof-type HAD-IIB family hydrolase [Gammaproteobacteria bacterium]|jgi:Cof subfamily protein (haloacid dehalogenase superfamily)|nr:Cof-type HAD-IIB family hydrolase [Gammaproteobacteria bacterium]
MDLIVFDLDGTLLNKRSRVSTHTRETLLRLQRRGIAYTVATGRTLHAARDLLAGHGFDLPHIYKNGVMIWRPQDDRYSHSNLLTNHEICSVIEAFSAQSVTPFIFTVEPGNHHAVYHPPLQTKAEHQLAQVFQQERGLALLDVAQLPAEADITNISALGQREAIEAVECMVRDEEHLVAYAGVASEGDKLHWVDIHHSAASKGDAVAQLKSDLGVSRVICFGDGDNDLSMFALADESYAPSNARDDVKAAATAVIGHHDEDGISHFLRQRFSL